MTMTDREIVQKANELAREFLKIVGGRLVADEFKFYDHHPDPRIRRAWRLSEVAFAELRGTDINDALANYLDEEAEDERAPQDQILDHLRRHAR